MNLFVIDCDSTAAFLRIQQRLIESGIDTWLVMTERGGHFWFLSDGPIVNKSNPANDININSSPGYVVAPPSVHPSGVIYDWRSVALYIHP